MPRYGAFRRHWPVWQLLQRLRLLAQLTGKLGPPIRGDIESCRHFKRGDEK